MCDVVPGQLSVAGSGEALDVLEHEWATLPTVEELRLPPPRRTRFDDLPTQRPFDYRAPTVALLTHPFGSDPMVANRLQAELLAHEHLVLVEPVHTVGLSVSGQRPGGGASARPTVQLDQQALQRVSTSAPRGLASGNRVAILDSGDLLGAATLLDFTGGLARSTVADDVVGHGTAVAQPVRALNPNVAVTALRVVNVNRGTSHELLCGLTYALWSSGSTSST